jgi:hypothetical protein
MRSFFSVFAAAVRQARLWRLAVIFGVAVAAGLVSDWVRSDQRLIFPRPLPVLVSSDCDQ